jgi:hypothetical protein
MPAFPICIPAFFREKLTRRVECRAREAWPRAVEAAFEDAIRCGAVRRCRDPDATEMALVSPVFGVEQNSKTRLIFDLRVLNDLCTPPPHLELDGILDVPAYLAAYKDATVAGKIDLTKAYWNVPVSTDSLPYLRCRGPDFEVYEWQCLPFGWSHAPAVFQAVSTCFRDAWRAAGLRVLVYLDDFVFFADTVDDHLTAMEMAVGDLLDAGWPLSLDKCDVTPASVVTYLGIDMNVAMRTFALPASKVSRLSREADKIWQMRMCDDIPLHEIETFAGRANFARLILPRAGAFLVHIYNLIATSRRAAAMWPEEASDIDPDYLPQPTYRESSSSTIRCTITAGAEGELLWWKNVAPRRLERPVPWSRLAAARVWANHGAPLSEDMVLSARSDASESGVGATWTWVGPPNHAVMADLLPAELRGTSSTARELYGAARLVEALPEVPRGAMIRVVMDSQCAVATARGGGVCMGTVTAARRLDAELERRGIEAVFEWAPRSELATEDAASRDAVSDPGNISLTATSTSFLWRWAYGKSSPQIDIFASEALHLAPRFGSRWPCRESLGDGVTLLHQLATAEGRAALNINPKCRVWAFPPFGLVRPAVTGAIQAAGGCPLLQILLIIPFAGHLHHCLTVAGWRHISGPRTVIYPCGTTRAPLRPLVAYASPSCPGVPPL